MSPEQRAQLKDQELAKQCYREQIRNSLMSDLPAWAIYPNVEKTEWLNEVGFGCEESGKCFALTCFHSFPPLPSPPLFPLSLLFLLSHTPCSHPRFSPCFGHMSRPWSATW